jgi:hypothetical protein
MNDTREPARGITLGGKIAHDLEPGFVMTVEAVEPCDMGGALPEEHAQFQVTDPAGNTDWLCAYDVHRAEEATP